MASIRNLSGAPSFGGSTLDNNGGSRGRRTRPQTADGLSSSMLPSRAFSQLGSSGSTQESRPLRRSVGMMPSFGGSQHHVAGEVIGSSSFNSHQSFSWRPRFHADASDTISLSPRPPLSILTPQSGRMSGMSGMRRLRSSTWDAGAGRLSPVTRVVNKSNSLDNYADSPSSASAGSARSNGSDPEGVTSNETTRFGFDDDADLFDSESDSEIEETKTYEIDDAYAIDDTYVIQDTNDIETKPELNLSHSAGTGQESDVDNDSQKSGATETKGIYRSSSHSTAKSESGKGVTFSENIAEYEERKESRPSMCAKLPAFTNWDDGSEGSEGTSLESPSPTRRNSHAHTHFHRQHSEPSRLTKLGEALNPFGDLSWSLIGSCIVRTAPCFWCSKKFGISATDREILLRLNILCVFFCVAQICVGVSLFLTKFIAVVEDPDDANQVSETDEDLALITFDLWSLEFFIYCLSIINLVLLIASMRSQRAIREVNLVGSVRFMWVLFWMHPLQIFFMIGLFDYFGVNMVKIKHWWDDPSMNFMRELFCANNTAHTKCIVPILGGADYKSENEWCQESYNATDCEEIRNDAQSNAFLTSRTFFLANAIWALVLALIMWVTLCVLQAIITLPIVQRSKESNIPMWLIVPIVGSFAIGYLLNYSRSSVTEEIEEVYFMAIAYLVSAGLFSLAALVGFFLKCYTVLNGRQRRIKQGVVITFIATLVLTLFSLGTVFITSLIYSVAIFDLPFGSYQKIACIIDFSGSCTGCLDNPTQEESILMCPEWTEDQVQGVLRTIMKQSATLAAIFLVYALIALRYGFLLLQYVSRYQIEYV